MHSVCVDVRMNGVVVVVAILFLDQLRRSAKMCDVCRFILKPNQFILKPNQFILKPSQFILKPSQFILKPNQLAATATS